MPELSPRDWQVEIRAALHDTVFAMLQDGYPAHEVRYAAQSAAAVAVKQAQEEED